MAAAPLVYILLLNYRGARHTLACLDSLRALDYPNFRIIVIDNASPDDSVAQLQTRLQQHPGEFCLIESSENLGFSGGNNLGIEFALRDVDTASDDEQVENTYIWLLNNDTTVETGTLQPLVAEAQKTGGLAGSLLLYPDGRYQQVGTRFHWWSGRAKGYKETEVSDGMPVETLTGASMLIPLKAFRKVGLMEPSFFLYFEDGEFSLRCARNGFPLTIAAQSKVYHAEGATTGSKSRATQYYYHRNRLLLLWQFANPLQKTTILAYTLFRLARSIVKSKVSSNVERRVSARIQLLAYQDFRAGHRGKCPHNLELLK